MLFSRLCASQQIMCFSAWPASQHLSFTISVKKKHFTTKHAFQQLMCFSAWRASQHLSFTISIKKRHGNVKACFSAAYVLLSMTCFSAFRFHHFHQKNDMIMSQQSMLFSRLYASQHDLLLSISCKFHHWHLAPWFISAPRIKGKCLQLIWVLGSRCVYRY